MSLEWTANLEIAAPDGAAWHFRVEACDLREALSARTRAVVLAACAAHADVEALLLGRATLTIEARSPGDAAAAMSRAWHLLLAAAEHAGARDDALLYRLELHDPLWLLALSQDTRKFRDLTADQIVGRVLAAAGVAHRFALREPLAPRSYCAQYRETNLAFVERLLASEGLFYRLDAAGTLVIADSSASAETVAGSPFDWISSGGALSDARPGLHSLRRGARLRTGRVTLADHDWKNPDLEVRGTAFGQRDSHLEHYEYPGGFRSPERGERLARLRLEAHRAESVFLDGNGSVLDFAPGLAFAVAETAGERFAGSYLLRSVEHRLVMDASGGAASSYASSFTAQPLALPFRPSAGSDRASVAGVHTALVAGPKGEEIHTDRHGRLRATFHWDREAKGSDEDSRWMRMLQETSSSMTLARTGWEVFVGYIAGDPDRPIGLARAMNATSLPSHALPLHQNRMAVRTPSSPASGGFSEVAMDDSGGAQRIAMRAEKDLDVAVKNEKTERIANDEKHHVGGDLDRKVILDQKVSVGGDSSLTVGENDKHVVEGSLTEKIGGAERVRIKKAWSAKVGGADKERVGALRLTLAGAIKLPDFKAMAKKAASAFAAGVSPQAAQAAQNVKTFVQKTQAVAQTLSSPSAGAAAGIAAEAARNGAKQAVGSLLPDPKTLAGALPSRAMLPGGASVKAAGKSALSQATGGLSDGVTLDKVIELVATGGIERSAGKSMQRTVGGAFIAVAAQGIDTKVGLGYVETVGAAKLSIASKSIDENVSGALALIVGGTVMRTSGATMTLSSGTDTSLRVGGAASYWGGETLTLSAEVIRVESEASLLIRGGAASILLSPSSATIKGELDLLADGEIILSGAARLDVT